MDFEEMRGAYLRATQDDIVTRLRNYDFMRDGDYPEVTMNQAADEIEDLRAELAEFQRQYQKLLSKYNG